MNLLIIFLPLLSAFGAGFFGWFLGHKGSSIYAVLCLFLTTILSIKLFFDILFYNDTILIVIGDWVTSGLLNVKWTFLFDSLSVVMLVIVSSISTLVHLYSIGYMDTDPHLSRFMSYLSLFTFFMIFLVTSDNFLQLFVGWEGVGLCSYLLISFWYTRVQANKSAIKAIILNRIGDIGLMLGIALIFFVFNSLDFSVVFTLIQLPIFATLKLNCFGYSINIISLICFFLFIGAVGKSAQLGLHVWLPDAMEGPTPVSALIHAATMVTAGVFLIIRCSILFEFSSNILFLITVFGAITAFFAATIGLVQTDIKKVIAYSTCSQLGYMIFSCGLSQYTVSFYHLINHAFFKALLFLGAGVVIHAVSDEQDMRKMGGLISFLPLTYSVMLIGSFSLMGFPFLTGFYSKDLILELAFGGFTIDTRFAYWLGTISAFFTSYYSIRLLYLTFLMKTNGFKSTFSRVHEGNVFMLLPLILLSIFSIFIGYFIKDFMVGLGSTFYADSIYLRFNRSFDILINAEFLPYYIKLLPVFFSLIGGLFAFGMYFYCNVFISLSNFLFSWIRFSYNFLMYKWFFDVLYNRVVGLSVLNLGYNITYKLFDKGVIEFIGPFGLVKSLRVVISYLRNWHSNAFYNYMCFIIFISLLIIYGYLLFFGKFF